MLKNTKHFKNEQSMLNNFILLGNFVFKAVKQDQISILPGFKIMHILQYTIYTSMYIYMFDVFNYVYEKVC